MPENLDRGVRSHYKIEMGKMVPKKNFETEMDVLTIARWLNCQPHIIHKMIAYKCSKCNKWHIGRSNIVLTNEDREKYSKKLKEFPHFVKKY